MTAANTESQKEVMVRLELMLEQEEIHWFQRARANWLKQGDRNTSFFHNFATKRRKKNTIKDLMDDNGTRHEDGGTMCNIVQSYFETLFTSEVGKCIVRCQTFSHLGHEYGVDEAVHSRGDKESVVPNWRF